MLRFLFKKLDVYRVVFLAIFLNLTGIIALPLIPIDRVIGGNDAKLGDYPAQVSLRFGVLGHYCGGTLITLSDVLTAAHCIYYGPRILKAYGLVVAGEIKSEIEESATLQKLPIKNVVMHPLYDCKTLEHDIGVVKLVSKFVETKYVKPMKIGSQRPLAGQSCEIIGWGSTNPSPTGDIAEVLQRAWVEVREGFTCGSIFDKSPYHDESMICVGALQERGICSGDSGGPLICEEQLAGIASAGYIPCAIRGHGGRFTDVSFYQKFIDVFVEWDGEGIPPIEKYSMRLFSSADKTLNVNKLFTSQYCFYIFWFLLRFI